MQWAVEAYPHVKKYVAAVSSKKLIDPRTKSYATESVKDPLLQAKLQSFSVRCNSFAAISENLSNRCTIGSFKSFEAIVDGQKP